MPIIKQRDYTLTLENPFQSPLLQRIYAARGIQQPDQLGRSLAELPSPWLMKDMRAACSLLLSHLQQQSRVLIVGDFDADGATSATVLQLGLKQLGFNDVNNMVPNRFEYGYGLTPEITEQALLLKPDLLITVDNGIASIEGVSLARSNGVDVLVTDHHLAGEQLPGANAILNPNQPNCEFPSKAIAGVGVVFFLLMALRAHLREVSWFEKTGLAEPNLAELLDLVALGTVADVVPLDVVNRVLVHQGLRRIRAGRCRPGIKALLTIAKRDFSHIVAADLGFAVGPRLNAAGRLDDMSVGIACLMAESAAEAHLIATELDALNADRRSIEQGMQQEAERLVQSYQLQGDLPAGLCVYEASWHQGVVGIVASRIKEKYYRPVIAFADAEEGFVKGSARSIPGIHIRDVLALIAAENPHVLEKFGGHAMAAGLSLASDKLPEFKTLFHQAIITLYCNDERHYQEHEIFQDCLHTDGQLQLSEIGLDSAMMLEQAGPWGQQFPEPVFWDEFELASQRILAEKHLKVQLKNPNSHELIDAIAFNIDTTLWPNTGIKRVKVAFRLNVNRFRGAQTLQLMIETIDAIT